MESKKVLKWKKAKKVPGWFLYCGTRVLGEVSWDLGSSIPDMPYIAHSTLPGMKPRLGFFKNTEEAKAQVELAAEMWFSKLQYQDEETE